MADFDIPRSELGEVDLEHLTADLLDIDNIPLCVITESQEVGVGGLNLVMRVRLWDEGGRWTIVCVASLGATKTNHIVVFNVVSVDRTPLEKGEIRQRDRISRNATHSTPLHRT